MTNKQRTYKYNQYAIRHVIDNYICCYPNCNFLAIQIGHRISQSKMNIAKYGLAIVNHNFNLVPVCCLEHNDYFNIGQNREAEKKLVNLIKLRTNDIYTTKEINERIKFKNIE